MNNNDLQLADTIVHNAKVTTLQDPPIEARAFAISGEMIVAVGNDAEVLALQGPRTQVIDAGGRRVIPGLNDSHLHAIRGGVMYNLELRWDGVASLVRGLRMIADQAKRTPQGQWVRVMGGWSPYQFAERRMPTIAELNDAAPDTPVLVLFAYSEVLLNKAAVSVLKLTRDDKAPNKGEFEFADDGLMVRGTLAVYATIAKLPPLESDAEQLNSTQYFLRELNRFGMTSTVDAGASGITYPDDYKAMETLAARPDLPVRLSNFLFPPTAGSELNVFKKLTADEKLAVNKAVSRLNGFVLEGAGELLLWSASDFENFMAPRPELNQQTDVELADVTRVIAKHQWPIRIHATYDETITRILDVFEPIFKETGYTARWAIDHAETITPRNIARIKAMGGAIAVQDRLAFAGEFFAQRYGKDAAASAQPLRQIVDAGIPVGAGTDATRVSGYNPWLSLAWMVTGKTLGGTQLASPTTRLTREEALRLYTVGSAWFSHDEDVKGRIAPGQLADFAILSADYLSVPPEQIGTIESVLTVTGGSVVYSAAPYTVFTPDQLPPVTPAWSPVAVYGGYQQPEAQPVHQ